MNDHQNKLIPIFGRLTAAVFQQGLAFSRQEDPHNYRVASELLRQPGHRFELRITMGLNDERFTTQGLIVDDGGEALVQVFEIFAEGKHHA